MALLPTEPFQDNRDQPVAIDLADGGNRLIDQGSKRVFQQNRTSFRILILERQPFRCRSHPHRPLLKPLRPIERDPLTVL